MKLIAFLFGVLFSFVSSQTGLQSNAVVEYLNKLRALHAAPPVTWNPTIAAFSLSWSQNLASTKKFTHSETKLYGENIAWFGGVGSAPNSTQLTIRAINLWYNENINYNYTHPNVNPYCCLHFTALNWLTTTEIGSGESSGYVTMNFYPPGNYLGSLHQNVLGLIPAQPISTSPKFAPTITQASPTLNSPPNTQVSPPAIASATPQKIINFGEKHYFTISLFVLLFIFQVGLMDMILQQ